MRPQLVDKIQSNDFIAENIGANAKLKHKVFCHFFVVKDPITTPPPREKCPNYVMNIQHQCRESQNTKSAVASTKGLEMAYKQTELQMMVTPGDNYYCVDIDNLFNSVLLCIAAMYYFSKKEQLSGKRADVARGTVKEAVFQDDSHADTGNNMEHKVVVDINDMGVEATLVNAYRMCFVHHLERRMEMPWIHYEFNLLMGCAWINPNTDRPTQNRYKTVGRNSTTKEDGVPKITRGSLCPVTGDLNCRLDSSFLHFLFIPSGSNKNTEPKTCQLHTWAAQEEGQGTNKPAGCRKGVLHCKHYDVHLCIPCFFIFYEVEDL
eukprot:10897381-Ditylum_brightwellii.AAC.1